MENASSSTSKLIAPIVIGAVVLAGGSFYGGMQYQKRQAPAGRGGNLMRFGEAGQGGNLRFGGTGAGQAGGGARMAGAVAGEVTAKDDTSLTLKLRDGGSRIVFTASSTTVGKMSAGTLGDLATGTNVTVMGTPNSDGSLTASSIQIRPAGDAGMPFLMGGAGGGQMPRGGQR